MKELNRLDAIFDAIDSWQHPSPFGVFDRTPKQDLMSAKRFVRGDAESMSLPKQ